MNQTLKIRPRRGNVVVERATRGKTASGLHVPDNAKNAERVYVRAVAPGVPDLMPGDEVLIESGIQVNSVYDSQTLGVVHHRHVICTISEGEEQ